MNKIEIDLVNKKLNNETLNRQKDIMTRLLEAEKSDRQRDQDQKRQAETAREQKDQCHLLLSSISNNVKLKSNNTNLFHPI